MRVCMLLFVHNWLKKFMGKIEKPMFEDIDGPHNLRNFLFHFFKLFMIHLELQILPVFIIIILP